MSPDRALLVQLTMALDQMSAAAADLILLVDAKDLVEAVELHELVASMTERVERAVRDINAQADSSIRTL